MRNLPKHGRPGGLRQSAIFREYLVPAIGCTRASRRGNPADHRWLWLRCHPSVSRDGAKLVFTSERFGNRDVWIKDLKTGREAALTSTPLDEAWLLFPPMEPGWRTPSPGSPLSRFTSSTPARRRVRAFPKRCAKTAANQSTGRPTAAGSFISPAGPKRWAHSPQPREDQDGAVCPLRHRPAQFAPDGAWISVVAHIGANRTRIFAIPIRDGAAVSESQWIPSPTARHGTTGPLVSARKCHLLHFPAGRL